MSLFKLCVANLVTLFWVVVPAVMGANIIPQPSYVQEKQGTFDLAHNNNILYAGKHPEVNQIIDNFMEQVLGDYGLRLQANKSKKAGILLQDKKSLNEEAYELSVVANKVVIKASAPAGFFMLSALLIS
jgi:hexosaminidase